MTDLDEGTHTPASQPELLSAGAEAQINDTRSDGVCDGWTFKEMYDLGLF